MCPTYSALVANGFTVEGSYAQEQCVDAANVSAGIGGSAFTIYYTWSGGTSAFTQNVENVFSWRYYLQFYADNADFAGLTNDDPILIIPNDYQHTGYDTGEYKCKINDDTQAIVVSFWCEYPRGFIGTENHWTTYQITRVGSESTSQRAGSLVNSATISIPISVWRHGTSALSTGFDLSFLACVSAQTYGSTFRQEINKILNEGE